MAQVVPATRRASPWWRIQNAWRPWAPSPIIVFRLEASSRQVLVEGLKRSARTDHAVHQIPGGIGVWTGRLFRQLLADQSQRSKYVDITVINKNGVFFQLTLWVNRNRDLTSSTFPVGYFCSSLSEPLAGSIA